MVKGQLHIFYELKKEIMKSTNEYNFMFRNLGLDEFFLSKLAELYEQDKLGCKIPPRKSAAESISIDDIFFDEKENLIHVSFTLWWGGDNYDKTGLSMSEEQWNKI